MCQIFVQANPMSYEATTAQHPSARRGQQRKAGNLFWDTLEEIATRDGMNVPQLLSTLYDELLEHRGDIPNFSSFLRVSCQRYMALQVDSRIPRDLQIPIRSLNAPTSCCGAQTHFGGSQSELSALRLAQSGWHT